MSRIKIINEILKDSVIVTDDTAARLNHIFSTITVFEQASLYSDLTDVSLSAIVKYKEKLNLSSEALEHIVWYFYKRELDKRKSDFVDDKLLSLMVDDYAATNFLAIESLIIEEMKNDAVTESQIASLSKVFQSKIFLKELYIYKCRNALSNDKPLSKEEVLLLVSYRAYKLLNTALEKRLISKEGLGCLTIPPRKRDAGL